MSEDERIAQHRSEMPRRFRDRYDPAMSGRSRKSAMRIFCAECCGYEIQEGEIKGVRCISQRSFSSFAAKGVALMVA